jgi:hypothetical protein
MKLQQMPDAFVEHAMRLAANGVPCRCWLGLSEKEKHFWINP